MAEGKYGDFFFKDGKKNTEDFVDLLCVSYLTHPELHFYSKDNFVIGISLFC